MHSVSIVIPVYGGELTLGTTLAEIAPLVESQRSPNGTDFGVTEVILVHDNGPDDSARVIREAVATYPFVSAVWLSRNYGQHAATLAGMAASSGDWVATLDEDGQQDPKDIGTMLDAALAHRAQVVYARPTNRPPHGFLRNLASRLAKSMTTALSGNPRVTDFNSYRLVLGSVARGVAAYAGPGVYLDIALGWVAGRFALADVTLRTEGRTSGYRTRTLLSHFWRLVISSGTRALRVVSLAGVLLAALGGAFAVWLVVVKIVWGIENEGWTSIVTILLIGNGAVLFALGVIAEYIGANVNMAMGKPAYFITSDPAAGPLGRGD